MKKIYIFLIFSLLIISITGYIYISFITYDTSSDSDVLEQPTENITEEKSHSEIQQEIVKEKIEKIKKRLALKGLISEGDEYFYNDQLTLALKNYLQAYKQNKEDEKIIKKLGDTYFEMKKFNIAKKYYLELLDYPSFDINKLALSIIYQGDYNDDISKQKVLDELKSIELPEENYFYYSTSISCIEDFHQCKIDYDNRRTFDETTGEEIVSSDEKLREIHTAIENYRNFQVDQIYYKNALIVGAFYTNKNYPIAIALGEQILQEKNDYKPLLKIIADSYYKLGDFENAKKYLSSYYKQDNSDGSIAYLLGVIHGEEGDYVLSNIYLNKALQNGYTPTIDIRRKLIHNYYLLESEENIIHTFYDLIEKEEDYDKSDLELAIYYYILYEQFDQAKIWIHTGMEKFPTEENFHGYLGWIKKEEGKFDEAKIEIQKGLEINKINPFLNYNMGLLEKETGNTGVSLLYFKKVIQEYPDSEFGISAREQLSELSSSKK